MSALILPTDACTPALTKSWSVKVVTEESSYAAHAELTVQSNINPLSLKKPLALPTASKPPPVKKTNSTQKHRMKKSPKMKNCHMLLNSRSQSALPGLIAVIFMSLGSLGLPERHTMAAMGVKYLSFADIRTPLDNKE